MIYDLELSPQHFQFEYTYYIKPINCRESSLKCYSLFQLKYMEFMAPKCSEIFYELYMKLKST